MKAKIKTKYQLIRGTKWTKLLLNDKVFQQWLNLEIETRLGSFENQVKWFEQNLK